MREKVQNDTASIESMAKHGVAYHYDFPAMLIEQRNSYLIENLLPYLVAYINAWIEMIEKDERFQIFLTSHDGLVENPKALVAEACNFFGYNMSEKMVFLAPKKTNSFVPNFRKGTIGEYRNELTLEQQLKAKGIINKKVNEVLRGGKWKLLIFLGRLDHFASC